ncbi:MAG TPA: hypothetical protein DCG53_03780 [Syntrophus sp. (in: bacteria)]|nr:hypothetical protein [Syntrophus sp. (in: bacteria)]
MEIKPAYPVAAPEKSPAILAKKGRRSYADLEIGDKVQDVILRHKDIEDIVDITTDDIIHIDLTYQKSSPSVRDHSAIMYSLSPPHKEKGTVIDIWA